MCLCHHFSVLASNESIKQISKGKEIMKYVTLLTILTFSLSLKRYYKVTYITLRNSLTTHTQQAYTLVSNL